MDRATAEVVRLARELVEQSIVTLECDNEVRSNEVCGTKLSGIETCSKCGESVPWKETCDNTITMREICHGELVEDEDVTSLLRELRLALVTFDMAAERAKETRTP